MQSFAINHLEPHESHFCLYLRLNLKHYEEYTNYIHGGTTRVLKHNSARVSPNTKIEKSTAKKKSKLASLDSPGTKICSKLAFTNKVVPIAEAIILDNLSRKDQYKR